MIALQTIAVAFAMFSALPMPQFDWNKKNMRYALCAFPLVGVVCGALWCVCGVLPLPAAVFAASSGMAVSRVTIRLSLWGTRPIERIMRLNSSRFFTLVPEMPLSA